MAIWFRFWRFVHSSETGIVAQKPQMFTFAHPARNEMPDLCMEYAALGYHGELQ
jgi:hypothetical protein